MPARRTLLPPTLTTGPFTAAEARAAGVSARALAGPAARPVFRGVHVARNGPDSLASRVAAARRVLPSDVLVTGVTALQLLGLDLGPPLPLRFVTAGDRRTVRPGLALRRTGTLPPGAAGVARPAYAWLAAAVDLDLVDLVSAGDWLVRRRHVTPADLATVVAGGGGRGVVLARRAAALVRERVDSVRETRLRLLLVLADLPEPECNVRIGSDRRFIATVDLLLRAYRTIWEYEGDQHRTNRGQWDHDITRYEDATTERYRILRVTAQRMRHPRALVRSSYEVLVAQGYEGPPPTFSAEWCALFE